MIALAKTKLHGRDASMVLGAALVWPRLMRLQSCNPLLLKHANASTHAKIASYWVKMAYFGLDNLLRTHYVCMQLG